MKEKCQKARLVFQVIIPLVTNFELKIPDEKVPAQVDKRQQVLQDFQARSNWWCVFQNHRCLLAVSSWYCQVPARFIARNTQVSGFN